MKTIYLLLILLSLITINLATDDSCPTGMRKTFVDDTTMIGYGSARTIYAAVSYFQFPGSLFFSRKVLIEPRFEVHLKATTDAIDIVEKSREQKLYGFTIVISGYKNTISGLEARSYLGDIDNIVFTDIGYNNFVNSLIIEFDFEQDLYDPDSNSFSIRFCDASCHSYDTYAFYRAKLESQKYDPKKTNNWDFRLIYDTKKLYLYSGPNEIIYSAYYDLEATLGTNIAFVGFTGFIESNRRELSLIGSFICEDNYQISKMPGNFYIKGELFESAGYEAGTPINYIFSFINDKNQLVPHTFGYNIWKYNFSLNTDCDHTSYTISKETNYTLVLTMKACTKAGIHKINIAEDLKGNTPERYYIVHAGPLNKIVLIGHDGIIGPVPSVQENGALHLTYGDSLSGDFIIKENLQLVLDFEFTDQYGNLVTADSPSTLFTLKKVNDEGDTSAVPTSVMSSSVKKIEDHYVMVISANKIGTYQIEKNEYMAEPIRFIIIPGEANPSTSYCTLSDYITPPSLQVGASVTYNCYLRDDYGNEITTQIFKTNSAYDFSCQTQKTGSNSKYYTNIVNDKSTYFSCDYQITETGSYQINGYLTIKGTSIDKKINSKINTFLARGDSNSLTFKNILNLYSKNWLNINGAELTYISDSEGLITVLDLAESDGETLISSYGKYPDGFNVNSIETLLYSSHDWNYIFDGLEPRIIVIDGKEYIGIYVTKNRVSDALVKKSSFEYSIKFTLVKNSGKEEKIVALKYIVNNIGQYQTCFHDLKIENTELVQDYSLEFLIGSSEKKIGTLILKTVDYYLYNIDIGKEKIEYILEPTSTAVTFRIVPLSIEGTYEIYGKSNDYYSGILHVLVDGVEIRNQYISSQPSLACYLEFNETKLFKHLGDQSKEHYYEYIGDFVEGNLLFYFKIKDKYGNYIVKSDYFSAYADIYSEQYGNDITRFNVEYSYNDNAYKFRDNLPFESRKYSWVFFMRDSSCNNKYYIKYDGMRGSSTPVDLEKSYFVLLNNEINVNEYGYVDVYYKDTNDQFLGLQEGKLEEIKNKTVVTASNEVKRIVLEFGSITSGYAIRYKKLFDIPGLFKITTESDGTSLRYSGSDNLNVIDNIYSLKHSKLKLILDTIIDMDPNIRITIDNTVQQPVYNLYLFSATGVPTTYNDNDKFNCTLIGNDVNMELNIAKKNGYIQFTHKSEDLDKFKKLSKGDYKLEVSDYKEIVDYPIYLKGDGSNDASNKDDYDISKTEVYPVYIEGVAGINYEINIEFRASDGLRWNYLVEVDKFTIANSENLGSESFKYTAERGFKNGQAIIHVTQYKVSSGNILAITYKTDKIPKTVTLKIKCSDLAKLVYESGPIGGNVINPPNITFIPQDSYGNFYTDLFTSSPTQEYLNSLTVGKSVQNVPLNSNNYLEDNRLKVQYKSTISTDVIVTSNYFEETKPKHEYRIKSGPIDKDRSYAELITTGTNKVGTTYHIIIHPKDKYNNDIDDLGENEMKNFTTYYDISGSSNKNNVTQCELYEESEYNKKLRQLTTIESFFDIIECNTKITKTGSMQFHVDYIVDEIECRNCDFLVISNEMSYMNTKTLYKNKNIYLIQDQVNEVQAKEEPKFELTFFDQYLNQLGSSIVQTLNIEPILEGADIKLCIINSGEKKIVNLCPTTDGDDNINKWQYITNGENYKLVLKDKDHADNVISYPIKIIGGSEGSSDDTDFSKTNFNPEFITVQAGVEGSTIMEMRTAKSIRKNYWYPNPSEKIKIEFNEDKDTCTYKVDRADLPGRYTITIVCTKTNDNNGFTVNVEGFKLDNNIKVIILSGPAYYLEVEDIDKFSVSSDKYTWKTNPTNDDEISFNFKLKDKYQNYITIDAFKTKEITVISEIFGKDQNYYILTFKDDKKDYLFQDKIQEVVTKHVWSIICAESNRKYSFIYTKEPGKPDLNKSYWTIDKTAYVINELSTVLVTLKDRLGVNVGIVEGRLLKEKEKVKVYTNKDKDIDYDYNSITTENNIKYLYLYKAIGNYKVHVTYDGQKIKEEINVTVSYQKIDLKSSKLFYDLYNDKEILMETTQITNINNKEDYLFYKLYLYAEDGTKITNYDHDTPVTCKMNYNDIQWNLVVTKEQSYIEFTYESGFKTTFQKLPLGSYDLVIILGDETITYPLYLLGEKDVSPSINYDITKTHINPTYIDGIAGVQYEIDIEFRAKDNLRWNYEVIPNSFGISNLYNLDSDNLIIVKQSGEKSGQLKLLVTQKITSRDGVDNVLSFTYKSQAISTTVTLHITCADFAYLEYDDGAVDGTVVNPSIVKFIPRDTYGNLYTKLFDENLYPKAKLEALTTGVSEEGYSLTTNNYVSDGQYLNVQYGCTKVTIIRLTCNNKLNDNIYRYKLWSGPISPEKSYAEVEKTDDVKAGEITNLLIYPKDIYGNDVTNVTDDDLKKFDVDYEVNKEDKNDISDSCKIIDKKSGLDEFKCEGNVTQAGDVEFTVDFNDKSINCINCIFVINPNEIDFDKTKVYNKNENKEMSRTELNNLPVIIQPNFELYFFDRFMNEIKDKDEVSKLPVETDIVITDVKLCVSNNKLTKLSNLCKAENNDENEEKWKYLPNGDNYQLIVTNTKSNESLTFPVKLTGGYIGGDPAKVDPSKTTLEPSEIILTAGEEGTVALELRTENDQRKNYWYKEPEKHISVKFPDDITKCKYSLDKGEKPGDYFITFNCTEKKEPFESKVIVENIEVPKPVTITVVSAGPAKSRLFRMSGEEILQPNLGSVSVEDKFQMINKLYDQYDNLITNIGFQLSTLEIKMNPTTNQKSHTWGVEPVAQKSGDIIITLKSTYAGEHSVTGKYFPMAYIITFTPGLPSASNSELEVSKTEVFAGEEIKIYITPYDKYNNYIDASQYVEISPYQVKYINEGSTSAKIITEKYSIETRNNLNVLSYPGIFFIRGITTINGYIDIEQIKCISCRVNIKTKDIDFLNNYVLRYELSKSAFEILKNGTVEKNAKEEPIYRLYPRDEYQNDVDVIPKDILNTYKATLKSQNETTEYKLKLNNENKDNQKYAEFIIDDSIQDGQYTYKTLVGGYYNLEFTDGKHSLVYNISLAGTGSGGSNEPADYQKTAIIESNLKYIAGNTGYMIIEIRTKENIRKNFWDGFNFEIKSCDSSDKTFNYVQDKAGLLGVFYITVTTEKANTYPSLKQCKLGIYLNGEKIKSLEPEMEVSPDAIVRTNILYKYYKEGSKTNLLDGSADSNYVFEVESFDKYDNFAETIQDVVGIKVTYRGGDEVKKTTSETDISTGYRKYNVPATKAGIYIVSTEKSGPKGLYMANEAIFIINPGIIDLSKTVIKEKTTPIQAGTAPAISIDAYDKYGNALNYSSYINKFDADFIDASNKEHTSKGEYDKDIQKVFYTSETPVTIVGDVKVEVTYDDKEKLDTSKVIIKVIPGDPDPKNSILSRETSKGVITQYKNGDSFSVDVNELLILNVTLYDKYNNYISNIPTDVEIVSPLISGNYMEEIKLSITENTGYFGLDFNENSDYIYIYRHLVRGTYDLTYKVNTTIDETAFKYNIIITNGDDNHGNGPYIIDKSVLKPKNVSFVAGNYETFTLELKTAQGLLYNDDIDIKNDLLIQVKDNDTFTYSITKAGPAYGTYIIKIYCEKKGDYRMNVLLSDPAEEDRTKKEVGPGYFTVYPDKVPFKKYTIFTKKPNTEVNSDEIFQLAFTLSDKFNNTFKGRNDIVDNNYLTLINNNESMKYVSLSLDTDGETYKLVIYPKYPPKKMVINTLYNDGENSVYCFQEDLIITIKSEIDYTQTQIVSSNKEKINVGEVLDMWLYTFDKKGECYDEKNYSSNYEIVVSGPLDSIKQRTKKYKVKKTNRGVSGSCDNEYQIITTDDDKYIYAGNYNIKVYGDGILAQYSQVCSALGYSLNGFLLEYNFNPNEISILDSVSFTLTGKDEYGNKVQDPLYDDIEIYFQKNENKTAFESSKAEKVSGVLDFEVAIRVIGPHQLHILYKGKEVLTVNDGEKLPIFTILAGPCRSETNEHFDETPLKNVQIYDKAYFTFQCYDVYGNKIEHGGEEFTVTAISIYKGNDYPVNTAEVVDNGDGTYKVTFIPEIEGTYLFNLLVGKERYGEEFKWILNKTECTGETPVLCPNTNKCVSEEFYCIPEEQRCKKNDTTKPFYCLVNGEYTCVKSQTDCDCPEGYIKCDIMNYCVKETRKEDMCPLFKIKGDSWCESTLGKSNYYMFCKDAICRPKDFHTFNQRVCPIGKVLCADLSCRDNYDQCVETGQLSASSARCIGQQTVNAEQPQKCPSVTVCTKEDDVVCPDNTCVSNEIYCKALKRCPTNYPYLCANNFCAVDFNSCNSGISCPQGFSLCVDNICREYC